MLMKKVIKNMPQPFHFDASKLVFFCFSFDVFSCLTAFGDPFGLFGLVRE